MAETGQVAELSAREKLAAAISELGLSLTAVFVPFGASRSAGEERLSLNWRITLARHAPTLGALPIVTTDYSAGCGHCPAYKAPRSVLGAQGSVLRTKAIAFECENGFPASAIDHAGYGGYEIRRAAGGKAIMPDNLDVIWSLIQDCDVLNYSGFEAWAESFGYDVDSRKAEKTYRACLEIALKIRNAIGEDGLRRLQDAGQDY